MVHLLFVVVNSVVLVNSFDVLVNSYVEELNVNDAIVLLDIAVDLLYLFDHCCYIWYNFLRKKNELILSFLLQLHSRNCGVFLVYFYKFFLVVKLFVDAVNCKFFKHILTVLR